MANRKVVPESRTCPVCSTTFEVGGRGRKPRKAIYCSLTCLNRYRQSLNPHVGSHAPRPRKNRDTLHDEAWLRSKYLDERLTTYEIAAMLGCSSPSVLHALRKFSIPARDRSESKVGRPSTTDWTPEMRGSASTIKRGPANPMHGRPSPNRDPAYTGPILSNQRLSRYRVTQDQWDEMLAEQGGVCAICKQPETAVANGKIRVLSLDHDHATGRVRGILCGRCNFMIGLAKDDSVTVRSAAAYLEKHQP